MLKDYLKNRVNDKYNFILSPDFNESQEWWTVRFKAMSRYDGFCLLCGIMGGQEISGLKKGSYSCGSY
jgi:hypothetical protein